MNCTRFTLGQKKKRKKEKKKEKQEKKKKERKKNKEKRKKKERKTRKKNMFGFLDLWEIEDGAGGSQGKRFFVGRCGFFSRAK